MKLPHILSAALAVLMVVQSVLGRVFLGEYRDVERIRLTWFGNDWITLVVAAPLLVAPLLFARRGSIGGLLVWNLHIRLTRLNGAPVHDKLRQSLSMKL